MNLTVYLFGDFNNGYTQYPDDYTQIIFQKFYSNAKSTTQITIHREESLMYYGYIRKLEHNRYIGFCVVINGLMLTKFDELFSLFENTISTLVSNGQLIHFNEQGDIISTVDRLYVNRKEIDFLTQLFSAGFNHFQNIITPLPTINYSISKDTIKSFSVDDDLDEIVKSSYTFGYTYIFKSTGFNNYQLNSFKDILDRLKQESDNLTYLYNGLEKEHKIIIKQKKQYKFVGILSLLALGGIIGLISLNKNLSSTISDLKNAKDTIFEQNTMLADNNNQIINLKNEYLALKQDYLITKCSLDTLQSIIKNRQLLIIEKISYDFSAGCILFKYYGFRNESVNLQIRIYNDNGTFIMTDAEINVLIGENEDIIFLNSNLNKYNSYTFVILTDNVVLGGSHLEF